jgi:hypothetical protein
MDITSLSENFVMNAYPTPKGEDGIINLPHAVSCFAVMGDGVMAAIEHV